MVSFVNSIKYLRNNIDPAQTLSENKGGGNIFQLILLCHYYTETKAKERHHKQRKPQTNIPHENRHKNP